MLVERMTVRHSDEDTFYSQILAQWIYTFTETRNKNVL
jgi:hypothetical protein